MNLTTGHTVFIPGATRGIGLALALRLHAAGSTVVVGGRSADALDRLALDHPGLRTQLVDTSDAESIRAAAAEVITAYPDLDVVVAMAGIMRVEDWRTGGFLADAEEVVTTNLLGPIRIAAAFVEHLQSRPEAALVTVSSGLAHVPLQATPTYNATKAAVHMLSESIRLQLASTSVRVVEIVPPSVATDLLPGQTESPVAMPLDAFADEVMTILATQPDVREVLVERVGFLRFAQARGDYDEVVGLLNASDPHASA